jgi:isopentenyldiphosphate isomerase
MKTELFNEILNKVAEVTELDKESILHSNKEECTDARYVVVAVLTERLSDRQIAEVSGWSIQLVNKAKNSFASRSKFRWGLKEIYKELLSYIESK